MKHLKTLVFLLVLLGARAVAQAPETEPAEVRLPSGKSQRDEILKADYQKVLEDSRNMAKLAEELRAELEKEDRYVLSLTSLKRTEEIEKLAKRIRGRLKRF